MSKPKYKTELLCPVCGAVMGQVFHSMPDIEIIDGMVLAMVGSQPRYQHANASPDCKKNKAWSEGWIANTKLMTYHVLYACTYKAEMVACKTIANGTEEFCESYIESCKIEDLPSIEPNRQLVG